MGCSEGVASAPVRLSTTPSPHLASGPVADPFVAYSNLGGTSRLMVGDSREVARGTGS